MEQGRRGRPDQLRSGVEVGAGPPVAVPSLGPERKSQVEGGLGGAVLLPWGCWGALSVQAGWGPGAVGRAEDIASAGWTSAAVRQLQESLGQAELGVRLLQQLQVSSE